MKKIFLIAAICLLAAGVNAQGPVQEESRIAKVPAYRGLIERVQPNGDTLRTYLRGDERKHWMMTEDGWQILENKRGWLVYAKSKKVKGEVRAKESCRKAHNAEKRSKCEIKWLNKYGVKVES